MFTDSLGLVFSNLLIRDVCIMNHGYRIDLLVEDKLLIELKTVEILHKY